MNTIPDTLDIAPALKKLHEAYPTEQVQINAFIGGTPWDGAGERTLTFMAFVGEVSEADWMSEVSETAMAAADALIAKAGPRDPKTRSIAAIEKAKQALADAEAHYNNLVNAAAGKDTNA